MMKLSKCFYPFTFLEQQAKFFNFARSISKTLDEKSEQIKKIHLNKDERYDKSQMSHLKLKR